MTLVDVAEGTKFGHLRDATIASPGPQSKRFRAAGEAIWRGFHAERQPARGTSRAQKGDGLSLGWEPRWRPFQLGRRSRMRVSADRERADRFIVNAKIGAS
jgi:hypothetical protein